MNNTSPIIKKMTPFMTFPEAMAKVIAGYKVTRLEWNDENEYGIRKDTLLQIHTKGKFHQWVISESDMFNNDWLVVIDKKNETN